MKRIVLALLSLAFAIPSQALAGACDGKPTSTTSILAIDLGILKHRGTVVAYPEVSNVISTLFWFPFPAGVAGRVIAGATFTVSTDSVGGHFATGYGALGGDGQWVGYNDRLRLALIAASAPSAQLDSVQYRSGQRVTRNWPVGQLQTAADLGVGFAAAAFYPGTANVYVRFRADTGTLRITHCAR